jgi:hypothetical protein
MEAEHAHLADRVAELELCGPRLWTGICGSPVPLVHTCSFRRLQPIQRGMTEFMVRSSPVPLVPTYDRLDTFRVWTEFTVPTGKRSEHPRGMPLITRVAALQVEQTRETQWGHRVWISVEKRAPYLSCVRSNNMPLGSPLSYRVLPCHAFRPNAAGENGGLRKGNVVCFIKSRL